MSDTTGNPTPKPSVATDPTDATGEALPVATAAAALGITSDAIRARIRRGTMRGEKRGGAWFVYVPVDERRDMKPDSDAARSAPKHDVDTTGPDMAEDVVTLDATENPMVATSVVDLAPLVDHIATLEDRVQRLTEASTMWQIRARQAEEQLLQLTAGTGATSEAAQKAPESPVRDEAAPHGLRGWWRRFWRHVEGA